MPGDELTAAGAVHVLLREAALRWQRIDPPDTDHYSTLDNRFLWAAERAWLEVAPPAARPTGGDPTGTYTKVPIPEALRWEVFERDGFRCRRCGRRRLLRADHIVAESKGGPTTLENLQTLCAPCNSAKGSS